ncbi:restriction endonuclease subunit S [Bifidobacterium adolescentis]|uniref:restriction endonuclease subunit S n=1 Tax=Bifidobacterium adolescentis TaxID=1680 RepID=UPI003BB538A4
MAEQHEKALVPQIRFAGFTDPWEQRKVQDVADRFDNLRIPVAANLRVHGKTPYYGANGIQDYVDGFTHDGEFVLVAEDGANDLKNYPVKCVNGRIWVNNHAHVLQGKAGIADNSFLAFAISQSDIESLLVGGGRAKLNAETLMSIEFRLPCLQEQHQIGEYLTRLDHLITLHQRKYCGVASWMLGVALVRLGSESDGAFGEMKHVLR